MISVILPITYGDNERSRLDGIRSSRIGFHGFHQREYDVMCGKRKTLKLILSGC